MNKLTESQVEAIAQADAYLTNAGLKSVNEMLGLQAQAVQKALDKVLKVSVRSNYGAPAIYPANEAAQIFADIAGTKTLKVDTLAKAKKLGYRIEQIQDPASQLVYMPALAGLVEA